MLRFPLLIALIGALAAAELWAAPDRPPEFPAAGTVQVAFPPWDDAEALVVAAVADARRQVFVQAFSFTSEAVAGALIAAKRRGVDVRITADREQTFGGERTRIPDLAAAGIPIWLEVRYTAAHSKVMIIDPDSPESKECVLITGSYNWTWSAQHRNAENLLIVRGNPALTHAYLRNWERRQRDALKYEGSPR
jgi:phosphatidylserine/phosphatidylglycerophosphate/cardiolipin synthase-like enzyme